MSTSAQAKLSKKQKKGLAFRQRQKNKAVDDLPQPDLLDEDQRDESDIKELDADVKSQSHDQKLKSKGKGKATGLENANDQSTAQKRKKKETDETEQPEEGARPTKKTKRNPDDTEEGEADNSRSQVKARYILFVGNLKYTTSKESIQKHFAVCDPPPTVRLLSPKTQTSAKSKGCAFLEFTHRNALLQALKLHQSELEGRKINVELTAGGGGKSDSRINKIKLRNKDLASQRKKQAGEKEGEDAENVTERPQRHSKTSGLEAPVLKKRTWTVGDNDGGQRHRDDTAMRRQKRRVPKNLGSGANLIPIG